MSHTEFLLNFLFFHDFSHWVFMSMDTIWIGWGCFHIRTYLIFVYSHSIFNYQLF